MPFDAERHARLYYDPDCGPCRLFAGAMAGVSRGRLEPVALTATSAERDLGDLSPVERFASAHVVASGHRSSGAEVVRRLAGTAWGPSAERLLERFPRIGRPFEWAYDRLRHQRAERGCGSRPRN